jgi:hypothetical protein
MVETTTSRLKSVTAALVKIYAKDDRLTGITYTSINPTPSVGFTYDPYFPRLTAMTDGTGTRQYTYVPVGSLGVLQLQQVSGPLPASATGRSVPSTDIREAGPLRIPITRLPHAVRLIPLRRRIMWRVLQCSNRSPSRARSERRCGYSPLLPS